MEPSLSDSVVKCYRHRAEQEDFTLDANQVKLALALDDVLTRHLSQRLARKTSALGWLFAKKQKPAPVRGLYIHGAVGRGKTMLMDIFHDLVPHQHKWRAHFNDFMAEVHERIHQHRQRFKAGQTKEQDPIAPVAQSLAKKAKVLCFDEFTVTDIADAMILARLFTELFNQGCLLIATSNVAPQDLYKDGLNRQLFLPFIDTLLTYNDVFCLDSEADYRMRALERRQTYLTPLSLETAARMDEMFAEMVDGRTVQPTVIERKGRQIDVHRTAANLARFSFSELCEAPLGAADYLAIAARFDVFFVDNVPIMDQAARNAAKRFILLIDTLYDQQKCLVMSAQTHVEGLYTGTSGAEVFEFARTVSRLTEMQSQDWIDRCALTGAAERVI